MEKGFMDNFESEMTKLEKNRINIPEKERTGSGKYAKPEAL